MDLSLRNEYTLAAFIILFRRNNIDKDELVMNSHVSGTNKTLYKLIGMALGRAHAQRYSKVRIKRATAQTDKLPVQFINQWPLPDI
jgi:hypothetical protein